MSQTSDETLADGITSRSKNDRYRGGSIFSRFSRCRSTRDYDIHVEINQVGRRFRKALPISGSKSARRYFGPQPNQASLNAQGMHHQQQVEHETPDTQCVALVWMLAVHGQRGTMPYKRPFLERNRVAALPPQRLRLRRLAYEGVITAGICDWRNGVQGTGPFMSALGPKRTLH